MTGSRGLLAVSIALLALATRPAGAEADERPAERKRVVVRVETGDVDSRFNYVFVDHRDGEPVLLETRFAERGHLGVSLLDLTPELRAHFGAPAGAGVMISRVEPDGPAALAGVETGDVVLEADGEAARSATELVHRIAERSAGDRLALRLRRGDRELALTVTVAARERRQLDLGGLLRLPGAERRAGAGPPAGESLPVIELDPESLERALTLIREHLDSSGWRRQLELRGGDRRRLEIRIHEIERQLRELERRLESLPE